MELRHLRYFQALARTLNFTRAAEQLHIAQPPLSRQIQQLEEMLGVALLERGRPLRLTEAGRFFHEQSATLLDQLESICDSTRRIGQGQRQWFGIGFVPRPSYADHVLALFATHGLSLRVTQWANEMQTAIGLVAAGLGATLVPASVQLQHRDDVAYQALADASLTSPIIVSRRQGDGSPHLRRCLALIGREDA